MARLPVRCGNGPAGRRLNRAPCGSGAIVRARAIAFEHLPDHRDVVAHEDDRVVFGEPLGVACLFRDLPLFSANAFERVPLPNAILMHGGLHGGRHQDHADSGRNNAPAMQIAFHCHHGPLLPLVAMSHPTISPPRFCLPMSS